MWGVMTRWSVLRRICSRTSTGLILSQLDYIDKILGKFNKDDSDVAGAPLDTILYLSKSKGEGISQEESDRQSDVPNKLLQGQM